MDTSEITGFLYSMPTDWVIIFVFTLLMIIDAIRVGPGRVSSLGIAAVVSMVAVSALGSAKFLSGLTAQFSTPVLQALLSALLLVLLFVLVRRVTIDYAEMGGQPIQAIFAGISVTALVVVAWVAIPAFTAVWSFSPQVQTVFGEAYRLWWILGSFAALAFARNA